MNKGLPPGWVAISGTVEPCELVSGYAARQQRVFGKCEREGCNRRVTLDPDKLAKQSLGGIGIHQIKTWMECSRPGGCGLMFHNEAPDLPLRLEQFVGLSHARIRIRCRGHLCKFQRTCLVEAMIKGLKERGQGDYRTEIDKLGAKMTSACPLCKKSNWAIDVIYADTDTMGWRSQGQSYFDRFEIG